MTDRKILYSPGYGAGWVTWHGGAEDERRFMLEHAPTIAKLESGEPLGDADEARFLADFAARFGPNADPPYGARLGPRPASRVRRLGELRRRGQRRRVALMASILIVEDDEPTARALARLFGMRGKVEVVGDLASARSKLTWKPYHQLVITDWCFPVDPSGPPIDGAGARVVAYAAQAKVPCIVYSGSERPPDVRVWITKGDVDGLRRVVRELLGDEP